MARQAGNAYGSGVLETEFVCNKCLEDNPRDKSLLSVICLKSNNEHGRFRETEVWWRTEKGHLEVFYDDMPGQIPRIRPMPLSKHEGKFNLCDPSRCWGKRCRFAHSIEEREAWNAEKFNQPKAARSK